MENVVGEPCCEPKSVSPRRGHRGEWPLRGIRSGSAFPASKGGDLQCLPWCVPPPPPAPKRCVALLGTIIESPKYPRHILV